MGRYKAELDSATWWRSRSHPVIQLRRHAAAVALQDPTKADMVSFQKGRAPASVRVSARRAKGPSPVIWPSSAPPAPGPPRRSTVAPAGGRQSPTRSAAHTARPRWRPRAPARRPMWTGGRIFKRWPSAGPLPPQPLIGCADAHTGGGRGFGGRRLFLANPMDDQRAHTRRRLRVTMDLHSGPPLGRNKEPRVNNVIRNHS